ncbi:hypothetical protein AAFF_G00106840 [Aldrovandia affinis]|uniref:Uncharacterized protein n=1 Tax=Aldrovandia affinis TaxID=143900 RepID=A0AAD7T2A0_9TELE|nr:hypothetical protein AAFF_G00106840 [Aldrovandia affinis]
MWLRARFCVRHRVKARREREPGPMSRRQKARARASATAGWERQPRGMRPAIDVLRAPVPAWRREAVGCAVPWRELPRSPPPAQTRIPLAWPRSNTEVLAKVKARGDGGCVGGGGSMKCAWQLFKRRPFESEPRLRCTRKAGRHILGSGPNSSECPRELLHSILSEEGSLDVVLWRKEGPSGMAGELPGGVANRDAPESPPRPATALPGGWSDGSALPWRRRRTRDPAPGLAAVVEKGRPQVTGAHK